MLSFLTLLYINFQWSRMWQKTSLIVLFILITKMSFCSLQIPEPLRGCGVLCVGKLIHIALKYVQLEEKWGVRSSLYALYKIGSNLVSLLSMYLLLSLLSVSVKPAPITLQRSEASHQGFKGYDERDRKGSCWGQCWGHWRSGYHNPATFKMLDPLRQHYCIIFTALCLFREIGSDIAKRIYLDHKVSSVNELPLLLSSLFT